MKPTNKKTPPQRAARSCEEDVQGNDQSVALSAVNNDRIKRVPSLDDVLGAFAMEDDHSRTTLERYLRNYSEHSDDLVELYHELQHDKIGGAS
jgi:ATP-dependent protease HslVU (ClpYQ) peptidase subunit